MSLKEDAVRVPAGDYCNLLDNEWQEKKTRRDEWCGGKNNKKTKEIAGALTNGRGGRTNTWKVRVSVYTFNAATFTAVNAIIVTGLICCIDTDCAAPGIGDLGRV